MTTFSTAPEGRCQRYVLREDGPVSRCTLEASHGGDHEHPDLRPVTTWTDLAAKYGHERQDGDVCVEGTVDSMDDEVEAGAELVRLRRRVEELQRSNQSVLEANRKMWGDLQQVNGELKIMQEDRDEYRHRWQLSSDRWPFSCLLDGATDDEIAIARTFVAKLMGEGRTEHGALDLANDERNLVGEAKDELDDSISYLLMVRRRMEIWDKQRVAVPAPAGWVGVDEGSRRAEQRNRNREQR